MVTHLTTTVFLYHHSEDSRTTGRNMLVKIFWIKVIKLNGIWLVVYTFCKR